MPTKMNITRRQLSFLTLGSFLSVTAHAAPVLPTPESLIVALSEAQELKQPLVVMVSLQGCAFCKVVRENYLYPLLKTGVPVVQINMRDHHVLTDFNGAVTTQDAWVRKLGITIAPTVLFIGANGREVASRLNGAYLPDFYNSYLEENLALARRAVKGSGA
jgi:thioredoxin-related protein